ncbi:ABC transporter ATP-binding protein [Priestia megaterium]|uniref:ABC transporter ATP-binding protein n=1 Tax=Priestia megaterium TaxID=1404 RepID=UPI001EDB5EE1|nr:ABC transporter ATP-binding protein [Priestia megaterium]MDH3161172.1 ABC transporter ATP-binding protein [Priestia megaterium]MED4117247.1 ABC transporter ATP-binding protein [Priestia megaterium]UKJ83471.1 ABC transporter ATP-binding protein [Priestia megaterium]
MSISLSFQNVSKIFESKKILNNISFDIEKGKITAFLGQNGAGKTTTLKIAMGLLIPDKGQVFIDNKSIEKVKKEVTFIPDYPYLYEELTGREYLKFIIELTNLDISEGEVNEHISYYELGKEIDKIIKNLSLGNKKKLALLGSLLNKPSVLLLDEFISGIDPVNMKKIKSILKDYTLEGNSVLLSTHQLEVAQTFCDALILINEGNIIKQERDISNIFKESENLEEYFISILNMTGDTPND